MSELDYKEILEKHGLDGRGEEFRYRMLSRMKADCDYYLGYGHRLAKHLWASNEDEQIDCMRALWESFSEDGKPEWLTSHQLELYTSALVGLGAKIYDAFNNKWNASEEVIAKAAAFRRDNPGLRLDNSGWLGCKFFYKTLEGATAVVALSILPEYYAGEPEIEGLTMDERWQAYDVLLAEGYKAHEYLLEAVVMYGDNGPEKDREKAFERGARDDGDRPLDEVLDNARMRPRYIEEPDKKKEDDWEFEM